MVGHSSNWGASALCGAYCESQAVPKWICWAEIPLGSAIASNNRTSLHNHLKHPSLRQKNLAEVYLSTNTCLDQSLWHNQVNDNLAQFRLRQKIPRASFFSWQGRKNQWQKEEQSRNLDPDWLLNLSSIQLSTSSLHLCECGTHHSQNVAPCRSAMECLCSAKILK